MSAPHRAFALATRHDPAAAWQFVSADATGGNLLRTICPFHARTWGSVAEIEDWIAVREAPHDRILADKNCKVERIAREFRVVPLALAVAPPASSLVVCSLEPKGKVWRPGGAEDAGEYHLR